MNPAIPVASHVAVRDGRILAAGTAGDMEAWAGAHLDERFADKVLMPGFVEGHAHITEGGIWSHTYVGYFPRVSPDGEPVPGHDSIEAVIARLKAVSDRIADPQADLFAWGFDPIYFGTRRLTRQDLDRVSATRPVLVFHSNLHILNVNSVVLKRIGVDAATAIDGVLKGEDGEPTGELRGVVSRLRLLFPALNWKAWDEILNARAVRRYGRAATIAGITTIADLHSHLPERTVRLYQDVTGEADFPARLVPALSRFGQETAAVIARLGELRAQGTPRLHFGSAKIIADGSIQAFTARLSWPGYHNGAANGLWYVAPDDLAAIVRELHANRVQIHIHTNGDEAIEAAINAIEAAQNDSYWGDHRHTLQHCQTATRAQFRRIKALGICVNLFVNHLYYWGDRHVATTLGPERAARMDAAGTALALGIPFSLHSDAPVTPLSPLFCAWSAVNRRTASGRVLAPAERIPVAAALEAVTLGAAYTLKLDHLVGSIETGKYADFAVLDDDPLGVDPAVLKDIPVWGTVLGGRVFPAPGR